MKEFTIQAHRLYDYSKRLFFSLVPDCEVNFVDGCSQMFLNLRMIASEQNKTQRRKIMALVISKCSEEHIKRFTEWLTDYFSAGMQEELFSLTVGAEGKIIPDKMLEKALNNIRKR